MSQKKSHLVLLVMAFALLSVLAVHAPLAAHTVLVGGVLHPVICVAGIASGSDS